MRKALAIALSVMMLSASAFAANADSKIPRLYTVIFGVVIDANGELSSFKVVKVTDPLSGSTDAVNVAVPESFVNAARKLIVAKKHKPQLEAGKPKTVYTYFYYDP